MLFLKGKGKGSSFNVLYLAQCYSYDGTLPPLARPVHFTWLPEHYLQWVWHVVLPDFPEHSLQSERHVVFAWLSWTTVGVWSMICLNFMRALPLHWCKATLFMGSRPDQYLTRKPTATWGNSIDFWTWCRLMRLDHICTWPRFYVQIQ